MTLVGVSGPFLYGQFPDGRLRDRRRLDDQIFDAQLSTTCDLNRLIEQRIISLELRMGGGPINGSATTQGYDEWRQEMMISWSQRNCADVGQALNLKKAGHEEREVGDEIVSLVVIVEENEYGAITTTTIATTITITINAMVISILTARSSSMATMITIVTQPLMRIENSCLLRRSFWLCVCFVSAEWSDQHSVIDDWR